MDEIYFSGCYFSDNAHMSHDASACTVSFETNDIARSGMCDGYVNAGIVEQG